MRFASPPVTGIVYRSPSSSSTMDCPSGDTSSEIQVPSDVVKSTLRVGFKGNESGRWAARGRQRATAEEHRGREPAHHWTPGWQATACRERSGKPGGPEHTRQA